MKQINWLHLTDLHYGQKDQNLLLPRLKKELYKDIEMLKENIGKIDVVFFTGDLTFSGKKHEFDALTIFLHELWAVFDKVGCQPFLIAIPGNHDLLRPDLRDPVVKVLRRYHEDQETMDEFWYDFRSTDYYRLIQGCFENFSSWYSDVALPKPLITPGLIPGDISTILEIGGATLKVVGLNTAFLELTNDNYLGKLALHPLQLQAITSSDPFHWIEDADISLLLTHHDSKWYDASSLEYYDADINPPSTFFNHLCGHLHEPSLEQFGQIGSPKRRIQLAPSLFGLEKIANIESRIHGYIAGSYTIQESEIIESIYPRIAMKLRGGANYQIAPDYTFALNTKNCIEVIHVKTRMNKVDVDAIPSIKPANRDLPIPSLADHRTDVLSLEKKSFEKELEQVPRVIYTRLPQHSSIRLIEQEEFVKYMVNDHFCWLITDWSLGEDEFIGSVSERLQIDNKNNFVINCEDLLNDDDLFNSFNEQTGIPFPSFCNMINTLDPQFLVLNQVHTRLYRDLNSYRKLMRIVKSVIDFCPNTFIILIARQIPDQSFAAKQVVKLTALDAAQIKSYMVSHPNSEDYLTIPDNLDKITNRTGGLPNRIDKFMNNLKYASFQELIELNNGGSSDWIDIDSIPKSLQETVSYYSETTNKVKSRSFKLLKILTVLANGETYNNLKRFISTEPISLDQIAELEKYSLIEIIAKNRVLANVDDFDSTNQIKLFRVPRQIRDLINTMITESEKEEILKNACNLYFGNRWREGNIKGVNSSSLKSQGKYLNLDNCQIIVKSLLSKAIEGGSEFDIERSANLAVNYCKQILQLKDYKNAQVTSEEIFNLLKDTHLVALKAMIAKTLGRSLRMSGMKERSVQVLQEAINTEGYKFSNSEKNSMLIDQAYAYLQMEQLDKAIACAKQIEKTASLTSSQGITAKYIIAQATLKGDDLLSKLRTLERAAAKANSKVLANNISLNIADNFSNKQDRERRFTKVVEDGEDEYNTIRAVVNKALDILENGNGDLSYEDIQLLNASYSYLYGQRMGALFDRCHKALWLLCVENEYYTELLNLFRHSSFFWRVTDQEAKEVAYFHEIQGLEQKMSGVGLSFQNQVSLDYLTRRKLEMGGY